MPTGRGGAADRGPACGARPEPSAPGLAPGCDLAQLPCSPAEATRTQVRRGGSVLVARGRGHACDSGGRKLGSQVGCRPRRAWGRRGGRLASGWGPSGSRAHSVTRCLREAQCICRPRSRWMGRFSQERRSSPLCLAPWYRFCLRRDDVFPLISFQRVTSALLL